MLERMVKSMGVSSPKDCLAKMDYLLIVKPLKIHPTISPPPPLHISLSSYSSSFICMYFISKKKRDRH